MKGKSHCYSNSCQEKPKEESYFHNSKAGRVYSKSKNHKRVYNTS